MKKKYLYFILLIMFICSGCSSVKYSVSFGEKINEKIDAQENIKIPENIGDLYLSSFQYFFQGLPYTSGGDDKGNYQAVKEFKSFDDFFDNSLVFTRLFDKKIIDVNGSKIKINIDASKYPEVIKQLESDLLEISVFVPYYVSSHNATSVSNNTYTWKINNIENANIKINFDMSKNSNYVNKTIYVYIFIGLFVIIGGVIIYFVIKNKKANEI